jgi:hypothetical protein
MADSIRTSLYRAKSRVAGAAQTNKFATYSILLVGKFQAEKGGSVQFG